MKFHNSILETIGNTPLIKLNKLSSDIKAQVFLKLETFNPGHSIKDRMALKMLDDAEAAGMLSPGGTIIECTSGNTGMGLAIAAAVRGYQCIFTTNDKQSQQKIDLLKALGAQVIVCPTNVTPEDPKSYYSVAKKYSEQIPNSFWFNQYDNLSNRQAHYESTGPEIWDQTDGRITHLIVGVGTGGTISGTGRYLKEQNPNVKILGIDTYGSVFKKYHETGVFDEKEIYPYITEGIGEDILPKNVDFDIIDHFEKVTDKDGAIYTRKLAEEEGILVGYSGGSAIAGLLQMAHQFEEEDVIVVIIHDHGSRYVSKIFNDDWMRERGFLTKKMTVAEVLRKKNNKTLYHASPKESLKSAFEKLKKHDISQMPVMKEQEVVGSISEEDILSAIIDLEKSSDSIAVEEIMGAPFEFVDLHAPIDSLAKRINKSQGTFMVRQENNEAQILTAVDIIQHLV